MLDIVKALNQEIWTPVVYNNEEYPNYIVSSFGYLKNIKINKFYDTVARGNDNSIRDKFNYSIYNERTHSYAFLWKIILSSFDKFNTTNQPVIHLDYNIKNNKLSNLAWADYTRFGKKLLIHPVCPYIEKESEDEIWIPLYDCELLKDFDVKGYYISSHGRIFTTQKDKYYILKPALKQGYLAIQLPLKSNHKMKYISVHRLVLYMFNPINNYYEMQVNHIDLNKCNNNISNLEWVTAKGNIAHSLNCRTNVCRLQETIIDETIYNDIINCYLKGENYQSIAEYSNKKYNINIDIEKTRRLIMAQTHAIQLETYLLNNNYTCSRIFSKIQLKEILDKCIIYASVGAFIKNMQWINKHTPQYLAACLIFNIIANRKSYIHYLET